MSTPTDKDYIEKCKHLIECRLEWAKSDEWKNRDFEYLAEIIFEKTKISISVSTLKRIWKTNERTPHTSTLNALAQFLDYNGWNDFKSNITDSIKPKERTKTSKQTSYHKYTITFGAILILVVGWHFFKIPIQKPRHKPNINLENIVFTSSKTVTSGLPNTVIFNYDISDANSDSAFIQQDWDWRKRVKISPSDSVHTSIYYFPGFYNAKLFINNKLAKCHNIHITTNGWMPVYTRERYQYIPFYLNANPIKDGILHISPSDLISNKITPDEKYHIGFYNSRDFGNIYCDNYTFETEIKNNFKEGGHTCGYSEVIVKFEDNRMLASFSDSGCISLLNLHFSDIFLSGKNTDLSAFAHNMSDWVNIKFIVVDKTARIFVNNNEIYRLTFKNDIGKVTGLSFNFVGCGAVRMAKLFDKNGKLVFEDNFEQTRTSSK